MKTPISILLIALAYWLMLYGVTLVPHLFQNYNLNLVWITVIVPNVMRLVVGNIPRLAVDRIFVLSTSLIALAVTFAANMFWTDTRKAIEEYGGDRSKTRKLAVLLMAAFTTGALATYFLGIDNSIYSNMGWENQGLTM